MLRHRAAEARAGPQGFHARPIGRNGPQRATGALRLAHRQLGVENNKLVRGADGSNARHRCQRDAAEIPHPHFRGRRIAAIRSNQCRRARFRQAQGRALCHLLRQLQQAPSPAWRRATCSIISAWRRAPPIPAAAACRFWNRPILPAWRRTPRKSRRNWCKLIDEGYDIVALTASCGLMLKFEWALIVPGQ